VPVPQTPEWNQLYSTGDQAGSSAAGQRAKTTIYIYSWGNNPRRAQFKGRQCRVLAAGRMRSVLLEFENGERIVSSSRALRELSLSSSLSLF
jgi:hypothetical protein